MDAISSDHRAETPANDEPQGQAPVISQTSETQAPQALPYASVQNAVARARTSGADSVVFTIDTGGPHVFGDPDGAAPGAPYRVLPVMGLDTDSLLFPPPPAKASQP